MSLEFENPSIMPADLNTIVGGGANAAAAAGNNGDGDKEGQGNAQVEAGTEISQGLSRSSRTDSRDTIAILAEQRRKEVGPLPNVQVTLHGVDMNRYAGRKTKAHAAFTMALFVSNITMLKGLCLELENGPPYHPGTICAAILLSFSIVLQVAVGVMTTILATTDMNNCDHGKASRRDKLNAAVTVLSFIITAANTGANVLMGQQPQTPSPSP